MFDKINNKIFDKILILTNPITYVFFVIFVIFWVCDLVIQKSQFKNLFLYFFKIKNLNKDGLKKLVKICEIKLNNKPNKWDKFVISLNYKKAKQLL